MCLFGKPGALKYMVQAGLKCMLARDINDAVHLLQSGHGLHPDRGTQQTDEDLERRACRRSTWSTSGSKAGVWNDAMDGGDGPHHALGQEAAALLLRAVHRGDAHHALARPMCRFATRSNGSEPGPNSPRYRSPASTETTELHTAAFREASRRACRPSAYFVRLRPGPPKPDVYLDDLKDVVDPYAANRAEYARFFCDAASREGRTTISRCGCGEGLQRGLGFQAPSGVRYELKPEYERFVALAGIADNMVDGELVTTGVALQCGVPGFRGRRDAGREPGNADSQEPWRFDVKIPAGQPLPPPGVHGRGEPHPYDLGNWVEAGFILKEGEAR